MDSAQTKRDYIEQHLEMDRTLFWFQYMDVNFVNVKESKVAEGTVE